MSKRSPLFPIKLRIARLIGATSRMSGRGSGTTLPGRALLRFEPEALQLLGRRLSGPITVISATNGKTTTATLLDTILAAADRPVVSNRAGSNMTWGVATALLQQRGTEGVFEVDEAWLPEVADQLEPDVFLLANLFRDQLDRHGEIETLATAWREMIARHLGNADRPASTRITDGRRPAARAGLATATESAALGVIAALAVAARPRTVVLNADDPLIADLGRDENGVMLPGVIFFGIEDRSQAIDEPGIAHDAKHCRHCGELLQYDFTLLGHLGTYACPGCGLSRPQPQVMVSRIETKGMEGSRVWVSTPEGELEFDLPLPGLYNVYNALAALSAALALGVSASLAADAIGHPRAAFGRVERIEVDDKPVSILLIKNPTGATEVLRTLSSASDGTPLDLWVGLNDGIADGRDISWIWDADFERLDGQINKVTCGGTRAEEMGQRLKYAGLDADRIVIEPSIEASFDRARAEAEGPLYALPTYTALLELRGLLARRGLVAAQMA